MNGIMNGPEEQAISGVHLFLASASVFCLKLRGYIISPIASPITHLIEINIFLWHETVRVLLTLIQLHLSTQFKLGLFFARVFLIYIAVGFFFIIGFLARIINVIVIASRRMRAPTLQEIKLAIIPA
ncbi:hypothetical protein F5Y08DRAFT_351430 [Xylaria arbuscula]|nr:hypothetical protein F5Y08DRAFT_351430 [Xylaria arbuscula]